MRMKFSVHTGAKFDDKAPDLARWPFQRPSVLKQIEKLARTTDYQLQEDYQWLCNAVHPSVGGMLSFTAPLLAHEKKTHAFHVVCEDPTRLRLGEKVPELKRTRLPKCEGASGTGLYTSKTEATPSRHVRLTPDNEHSSVQAGCPKSASSGHIDPQLTNPIYPLDSRREF
jgi:hypothetical protein